MTANKDKKQQPGKADAVEVTGEELSEKELGAIAGGYELTNVMVKPKTSLTGDAKVGPIEKASYGGSRATYIKSN